MVTKSFLIPKNTIKNLEYLSKELNKKENQILIELIEKKMLEFKIEKS